MRGEISDGMILAEDEVDLGSDHTGIMLLPDGTEPGTPLADVLPLARVGPARRIDRQPARSALLLRNRPRGGGALRPRRSRRSPGRRSSCRRRRSTSRSRILEGCPRYIGRLFEHVARRAVAGVAEGPAARCRHAPDLERRRRHQLRDARARQPAARIRLHEAPRRPHRRAACPAGRDGCARWTASTASSTQPT